MLQQLAIYIHWPFCKSKCPYCDFNSHVRENLKQSQWIESYIDELKFYRHKTGEREIKSVFFGGGTPSLMKVSNVETIIEEIDKLWGLPQGIEITLEANPTSVEIEKLKGFKSAGVNRVSIGIQSLRDDDLKALGRQHSVEEALHALKTAAKIFDRYSFDLIYARSGQKINSWREELNEALKYHGGHMSLYQLTIEQGTKFYTLHERGELKIPNEDKAADFYELTQEIMDKNNMPAYEISNHAILGEQSQHNLVYWRYGDYIGIGAGAHGRITIGSDKFATRNHKAPEIWRNMVIKQSFSSHEFEIISGEKKAYEMLMMGLRLNEGLSLKAFNKEVGNNLLTFIDEKKLQIMIDKGFVEFNNKYIKATSSGLQRLNAVLNYII